MKLKEGSFINFRGRLDEDTWTDQTTGESKSAMVIILEDIEYTGGKPKEDQGAASHQSTATTTVGNAAVPSTSMPGGQMLTGFTGYEPFGGGSFFDEN